MRRAGQKVYDSRKWRRVRRAYMESRHWICERCGAPASVCHHKTYLTADNISDVSTAYGTANLECLCRECHNLEHEHFETTGAVFTSSGDVARFKESSEMRKFKAAREAIANLDF